MGLSHTLKTLIENKNIFSYLLGCASVIPIDAQNEAVPFPLQPDRNGGRERWGEEEREGKER